jgi:hypothetical protein
MKLSIVQGGGLVPIVTTTVADSENLAPNHAQALRAKVEEADLFGLSSGATQRQPDRPSFVITVEDEDRQAELHFDDATLPDEVRALMSWVSSVPGREQRIGPPGRT